MYVFELFDSKNWGNGRRNLRDEDKGLPEDMHDEVDQFIARKDKISFNDRSDDGNFEQHCIYVTTMTCSIITI